MKSMGLSGSSEIEAEICSMPVTASRKTSIGYAKSKFLSGVDHCDKEIEFG
jgi:hypothetical protein